MFFFEFFRGRRYDVRGDGEDWFSGFVVIVAY